MTTVLRLADDLALPLDAATSTFGILGSIGSGKSNTAARFAEQMIRAGIPVAIVDPKGDWHGIRTSADGKGPGLSVPIFGGLHADAPLDGRMGSAIADLLVDERLPALLDVSRLSKTGERPRFLIDFFHRLYERHQADPHVRHIVCEEAHTYIPQSVTGDTARVKEAAAAIILEGRAFGLGFTAISQRSARLHKDVLEEVANLIVHRTGGPNDRKAIKGWVDHHDIAAELLDSLPGLATGEAWIWSPAFLQTVQRVRIARRETFDSGATPKVGETKRLARTMADVDMAAIKDALSEAVERAKADDPKELRRRIAALERELAEVRKAKPQVEVERVEVPVFLQDDVDDWKEFGGYVGRLAEVATDVGRISDVVTEAMEKAEEALRGRQDVPRARPASGGAHQVEREGATQRPDPPRRREPRRAAVPGAAEGEAGGGVKLGKGERKVLAVLAQYPEGRTYDQLAFLAGYSAKASTLSVVLANLRRGGLVTPGGSDSIALTEAGRVEAGDAEPLPTGSELLEHWRRHPRMGTGERKVLDVLVDSYPDDLSHLELCERAGYSPDASTIGVILSKLRKLGLVEKGARRLTDEFMEAVGG